MATVAEIKARYKAGDKGLLAAGDLGAAIDHLDAMAKRLKEARRHVKIGGRAMQIIDEALKQSGYDT